MLGSSAEWTEYLNNTSNSSIATTVLHAKMCLCQISSVDILKYELSFELFLYECLPNPGFPLWRDKRTMLYNSIV